MDGDGGKGLYQNDRYRSDGRKLLPEADIRWCVHYHNHDWPGPGNDAEEHQRKQPERLAEEYDHYELFADGGCVYIPAAGWLALFVCRCQRYNSNG